MYGGEVEDARMQQGFFIQSEIPNVKCDWVPLWQSVTCRRMRRITAEHYIRDGIRIIYRISYYLYLLMVLLVHYIQYTFYYAALVSVSHGVYNLWTTTESKNKPPFFFRSRIIRTIPFNKMPWAD